MDLVYYNNLLSSVCFIPLILFFGEELQIYQMFSDSPGSFRTFLIGIVVTGFFGFLINIAGFLQIKVTSPISHMISSAFRGVIQTVLGVTIFNDILTVGRIGSIGIILFGSCLYTWIKDYESKQIDKSQVQEEIAMNEKNLESGQRLLKTQSVDFIIEDDDDDDDDDNNEQGSGFDDESNGELVSFFALINRQPERAKNHVWLNQQRNFRLQQLFE